MALADRILAGDPDLNAVTAALLHPDDYAEVTGNTAGRDFEAFVAAHGGRMTREVYEQFRKARKDGARG